MSVVRVNVKLLLDENISPKAAETLCNEDGIDACHVRDRGGLGTLDHEVLDLAFAEDRILVTSNVADFVKLARARELHAGIVLIEEGASYATSSSASFAWLLRPSRVTGTWRTSCSGSRSTGRRHLRRSHRRRLLESSKAGRDGARPSRCASF